MGGINGMLYIDGQINTINIPTPPVIKLTDIISNNQSYLSEIDKEDNNTLNLSFDNKMVTIKVMAYENNIFRKKIYRWYSDGQEESITDTKRPELILRSLTPGVYHISASCSTKDGSWTTPQKSSLSASRLYGIRHGGSIFMDISSCIITYCGHYLLASS